jgi:pimeloyl-ACP methyl ester carboxylesterase
VKAAYPSLQVDRPGSLDVLLLHGAWCGGWCWDSVVRHLAACDVRASAPNLPCDDPAADMDAYVRVAAGAVPDGTSPLLVGHSLAGVLLEPLAEARPVCGLVYLAAYVPRTGMSLRDQWAADPEMLVDGWDRGVTRSAGGMSRWTDLDAAAEVLFGDSTPDRAAAAVAKLRPQYWKISNARFSGRLVTPSTYIAPKADRLLDRTWFATRVPRLLGVDPVVVSGGHCPMVSRPLEIARIIKRVLDDRRRQ